MFCTSVHSFVGARGQVRPTGVSAGECQGHQQSLTPLTSPKPPLQPSQPKFEPMQSVAMFHHTTKPTQPQPMECVTLFHLGVNMFQHPAPKPMQIWVVYTIRSQQSMFVNSLRFWFWQVTVTIITSFESPKPRILVACGWHLFLFPSKAFSAFWYFGMICQLYDNFQMLILTMMYSTIQL